MFSAVVLDKLKLCRILWLVGCPSSLFFRRTRSPSFNSDPISLLLFVAHCFFIAPGSSARRSVTAATALVSPAATSGEVPATTPKTLSTKTAKIKLDPCFTAVSDWRDKRASHYTARDKRYRQRQQPAGPRYFEKCPVHVASRRGCLVDTVCTSLFRGATIVT